MSVNRHVQLRPPEHRRASVRTEFFVLCGRRRVGKELLTQFCQGRRYIFGVADLDILHDLERKACLLRHDMTGVVLELEPPASSVAPGWLLTAAGAENAGIVA